MTALAPQPAPSRGARAKAPRDAEDTRRRLLAAAQGEFAGKGLSGARVDIIADVANSNKRMLYYYFGSKEKLYVEVLEQAYIDMRAEERALDLASLAPEAAIRTLVEFKFDYFDAHPVLISLLNGENVHGARYLRRSKRLRELHVSLVATIGAILRAGVARGTMRAGVDPLQLYMSIAALPYFFFANKATLSTAFGRNLDTAAARRARRKHAVEVILGYLRP